MAQYASLDEAFGGTWGQKKKPASPVPKEQDVHSSQKVYNSPTRRTEAALNTHSSLITNTLKSLPIGDTESNFSPAKFLGQKMNQREPFSVTDYKPPAIPGTDDFAYASTPPQLGQSLHFEEKLDKLMRMIEGRGSDTPSTHDLLLYIFTGVFALFILDSFVHLGKNSRR
jgi:hypothetical protein